MFVDKESLDFIKKSKEQKLDLVAISVISSNGSSYSKPGSLMLVNSKLEFSGILGTAKLHETIIELAKKALQNEESFCFENVPQNAKSGHGVVEYFIQPFLYINNYGALGLSLENIGKTLVRSIEDDSFYFEDQTLPTKLENGKFYQSIQKPYSLLIFGIAAHNLSMISMTNLMGWETTIADICIKDEFTLGADNVVHLKEAKGISKLDLNSYDAAVILSHNPQTDKTYLEALLNSNIEYIGMMGNKTSMTNIKQEFNLENEKKFFAPIGLDIGGKSHQAVALSICAQIEAKKNNKF